MTRNKRIDLIITVMTDHLRRFIEHPNLEEKLDGFFGTTEWRRLSETRAVGRRITYRDLLDQYEASLKRIGYKHVDDHVRIVNSRERPLYHLVFASKHPKGAEFFRKISQHRFDGQSSMDI
jgi:three-Cys-motif partner protein